GWLLLTTALSISCPPLVGVTTRATVAVAPTERFPSRQVTVPDTNPHSPCGELAETKVVFAGSVSLTVTPVAVTGAVVGAVNVYVTGSPAGAGAGDALPVSDRSAVVGAVFTVTGAESVLSEGFTSC